MIRVYVVFSGKVQSRGFRDFVWKISRKAGNITGWIKNRNDGTVEMEAQGKEEDITRFLELIQKGNSSICVEHADVTAIECVPDEKTFRALH